MNFWLASYPRSGNTLVRVLLFECFGLFAGSKYKETTEAQGPTEAQYALGFDAPNRNDGMIITKTHGHPEDECPAIYVLRNGLATIVSYMHYLNTYAQPVTLEDVIMGKVGFGSWSDHIRAWNPLQRPDTLLLRFEDVCRSPEEAVAQLGEFLRRKPVGAFRSSFAKLQSLDARFFRSGNDARNIGEVTVPQKALFVTYHGALMKTLGYDLAEG
jgi:hypothetical protein